MDSRTELCDVETRLAAAMEEDRIIAMEKGRMRDTEANLAALKEKLDELRGVREPRMIAGVSTSGDPVRTCWENGTIVSITQDCDATSDIVHVTLMDKEGDSDFTWQALLEPSWFVPEDVAAQLQAAGHRWLRPKLNRRNRIMRRALEHVLGSDAAQKVAEVYAAHYRRVMAGMSDAELRALDADRFLGILVLALESSEIEACVALPPRTGHFTRLWMCYDHGDRWTLFTTDNKTDDNAYRRLCEIALHAMFPLVLDVGRSDLVLARPADGTLASVLTPVGSYYRFTRGQNSRLPSSLHLDGMSWVKLVDCGCSKCEAGHGAGAGGGVAVAAS